MLFYTNRDGKTVLHKEVYQVVPEFRKLDDNQMLYVILYTDYFSIFHQYPDADRRRRAKRWVYGSEDTDPHKDPQIRKAIELYDQIQFNEKQHTLRVYRNRKRKLELLIQTEEDSKQLKLHLDTNKMLQKFIDDLAYEVMTAAQTNAILKGDKEMSLIEKLRDNKRLSEMHEKAAEDAKNRQIKNDLPESKDSMMT